jgi:hypothetical protein
MGPSRASTPELSAYQEPSTARIEPLEPVRVSRVRSKHPELEVSGHVGRPSLR